MSALCQLHLPQQWSNLRYTGRIYVVLRCILTPEPTFAQFILVQNTNSKNRDSVQTLESDEGGGVMTNFYLFFYGKKFPQQMKATCSRAGVCYCLTTNNFYPKSQTAVAQPGNIFVDLCSEVMFYLINAVYS